jgi:sulfide dehydrogenase cytochrome subunit
VLLTACCLAAAPPAVAGSPPGAASCSGCHGPAGSGPVPSLAGRPAADIVTAMQAFRDGGREATVMDRIAKGFSDDETRAIADWLAANRGAAKP